MGRLLMIALVAGLAAGCGDTDVAYRGDEVQPGEELEDRGVELDVEPVDLEETAWFREGRTVAFGGRHWVIVGEPVFDPAVERAGEFEGTPLYAEVGVSPPYGRLYIPLERDYWQLLEPGGATEGGDTATLRPEGVEGVSPTGDPTDTAAGGG